MIAELKPYPAAKDSGVPWLGAVPAAWERRRLKSLLRPIDRRSTTGAETLLSLRRDHGIVVYSEHFSRPAPGATTIGYKIVNKGQLVVNRLQANNGLVFDSSLDGLVSPDYSVFESLNSAPLMMRYLSLLLRTQTYRDHFRRESTGLGTGSAGFLRLYDDRLLETPVFVPSQEEQASILRFIDHADRRIRRYIRAKRKLIKLLEEQKQTIIHRAVTRGLDSNSRLKPSGIGWAGPVPEHWTRMRLKDVATVQTGLTLGKDYRSYPTAQYPYLRVANVQAGRLDLREVKTVAVPEAEARGCTLKLGDVLMTEGGDIDKLGRGCVWNGEISVCLHQNHIFAVRCKPRLLPDYLVALMASGHGRAYFQLTAKQTTNLAATNSTTLRAFPIFLPDVSEQRMILTAIAAGTGAQDEALSRARREIALLLEYRTRLIADLVTGKVDVGEAAARLPEDVDNAAETLDEPNAELEGEESAEHVEAVAEEAGA
jgi:type I restriction enzyme S subunit